jgi:two-component system, NtrC family, response regulator AtoC
MLSAQALDILRDHHWPGNIRELKHEMNRAAALVDGAVVKPRHLSASLLRPPPRPARPLTSPSIPGRARLRPIAEELRALERNRMLQALAASGYVQKRAAELIAMPLRTFRIKAKQYGISRARRVEPR